MSFHKPEFHETKSERKFYEGKKQKALRYLDHTREEILNERPVDDEEFHKIRSYYSRKLKELKKLVNDI